MKPFPFVARAGAVLAVVVFALAGCASVGESEDATTIERGAQAAFDPEGTFTPEQEYYIGRTFAAQVVAKYEGKAYDVPTVTSYLNSLGQSLALVSDMPDTYNGYHFLALDSDEVNAFAAPSGFIFVTRGMLRCARSEEEVAAILAHEIGHVSLKHALNAINESRKNELWALLGSEIGKEIGRAAVSVGVNKLTSRLGVFGNVVGDAAKEALAKQVGIFVDTQADIWKAAAIEGYSRDQEKEADLAAVEILHRLGYNPQALVRMLQVMKTRLKPEGTDFAKTHPDPSARIAYVEEAIKGLTPLPSAAKAAAPAAVQKRQARYKAALGKI